jgi:hypothetical protein
VWDIAHVVYEKEKFEKEATTLATVASPRNDHKDEALPFYNKNVFASLMSLMRQNKKPQGSAVKDIFGEKFPALRAPFVPLKVSPRSRQSKLTTRNFEPFLEPFLEYDRITSLLRFFFFFFNFFILSLKELY